MSVPVSDRNIALPFPSPTVGGLRRLPGVVTDSNFPRTKPNSARSGADTSDSKMPEGKYPFWLGGIAASMAATFTHPLDLTKVRMQTTPAAPDGTKPTMLRTLQHTVHTLGVRGVYTGLTASLMRQMSYSLVRIGSYESIKRYMTKGKERQSTTRLIIAGALAGGLGGVAGNPADILLVRMTSDSLREPKDRYGYKNAVDGLVRLVREEGVSALGRGLGANTIRAVLMNASQLATYDSVKSYVQRKYGWKDGLGLHVLSSTASGIVATTVCSPADVIKSRVMHSSEKHSVLELVKTSLREEGIRFLFKGWTPAFVRLAPNTILMFVFMEQLKKAWNQRQQLSITSLTSFKPPPPTS